MVAVGSAAQALRKYSTSQVDDLKVICTIYLGLQLI